MNSQISWEERRKRYSVTVLDMVKVKALAGAVARAATARPQLVTYEASRSRTITSQEWQTQTTTREVPRLFGGTRTVKEDKRVLVPVTHTVTDKAHETLGECWQIEQRRWSLKEDRSTGSGEYSEDVEVYCTYLRSDGALATTCEEWRESYMYKRFEMTNQNTTVSMLLSEGQICKFDFERHLYRRREGAKFYESDRDPSDRMKPFVHTKGDGIRAMLLELAPEDQRVVLRRTYPNLVKVRERLPSHTGTVLRYWPQKNFGFIGMSDTSHADVFLHGNQVPEGQRHLLAPGAIVKFDIRQGAKGPTAQNVRIVG